MAKEKSYILPIILGVGALGLVWIASKGTKAYKTVKNTVFSFLGVGIENIGKNDTTLGVWLNYESTTAETLLINGANLNVFMNNVNAGLLQLPYQQFISPGKGTLYFTLKVSYASVGDEIMNAITMYLSRSIKFVISGSITIENITVPVPTITVYEMNFATLKNNLSDMITASK